MANIEPHQRMAPSKFQIYVDQSMRQVGTTQPNQINSQQQQQEPQQQQPKAQQQQQQQYLPQQPYQPAQHHPYQVQQQQQPYLPTAPQNGGGGGDQHAELGSDTSWPRYIKENLDSKKQMFYFDERKIYPANGGEFSFEELNLIGWTKRQSELALRRRCEELEAENEELKSDLEAALQQLSNLANALKQVQEQQQQQAREHIHENQQQRDQHHQQQRDQQHLHALQLQQHTLQQQPTQTLTSTMSLKPTHSPPSNRLSIVPQSLQPAHCNDADTSCYGQLNEAPSVVQDLWKQTDKFTVPIDQSQYIREHCPTSTPSKEEKSKKTNMRRMSRPSIGGSPTMKLSPITETSRDCNSKSSSSSSAIGSTPGTTCKRALQLEPLIIDEPDRPLDPNDPTTYRKLLRALVEPLERRSSYLRVRDTMPKIDNGICFDGGRGDRYLVDKLLSKEAKIYTAQLLDSSDDSNSDLPVKTICFRVDQPSNDWLFYICDELHKRLVRQKMQPDIELSVMNADPAIIYLDGSILVDEYFRCVPLEEYLVACSQTNKPFPKSVAAYLTLELLQLIRVIHSCDIVHMNMNPKNIIITGCPTREDISGVDERTSIVKLIGFDHSVDTRLLPKNFKFENKPDYINVNQVLESKPWLHEVDWIAILNCIHKMFFLEDMEPTKVDGRWKVDKQFKGFPTNVWNSIFDGLLNIDNDIQATNALIERVVDELSTWIKANISFVLREAVCLDTVLENFCTSTNRSVRLY
uniref:Mitotic checkpoint serine/threonine-protein kinase BUB1 n=1 Tax=Aceria tosichella TaxID=561515 RepID=A0A6G1SD28_9ACAR